MKTYIVISYAGSELHSSNVAARRAAHSLARKSDEMYNFAASLILDYKYLVNPETGIFNMNNVIGARIAQPCNNRIRLKKFNLENLQWLIGTYWKDVIQPHSHPLYKITGELTSTYTIGN